jgi:hypothetical protein
VPGAVEERDAEMMAGMLEKRDTGDKVIKGKPKEEEVKQLLISARCLIC